MTTLHCAGQRSKLTQLIYINRIVEGHCNRLHLRIWRLRTLGHSLLANCLFLPVKGNCVVEAPTRTKAIVVISVQTVLAIE